MAAYSSFFSSGLLAPHHSRSVSLYCNTDCKNANNGDQDMDYAYPTSGGMSPATPSSPIAMPDDSDIEIELNGSDRGATPTPESRSRMLHTNAQKKMTASFSDLADGTRPMPVDAIGAGADNYFPCSVPTQNNQGSIRGPRLRRRRSSLAGAQSVMSAIKSPSRNVGQAFELQKHLLASPPRSRSGSIGLSYAVADIAAGVGPEQSTILNRMRSGSIGGSIYKRRGLRRINTVPAPVPPPTAPLPDLPPSLADTPICDAFGPVPKTAIPILNRAPLTHNVIHSTNLSDMWTTMPTMYRNNRDRSYSIVSNAHRINEDMKEN
ncbi:hypothetical protein AX17_001971 [Amanita inopinata Kibby_2008]|nr:hypothetical protein AX17_001971 [Amanita inopinata Kibby_2008]